MNDQPYAIILGGTSGLGKDIAIQCLHHGVTPIILGRNIEECQRDPQLTHGLLYGVDLTNPRVFVADEFEQFQQMIAGCRITHVFWIAGIPQKNPFNKMSSHDIVEQIGVHLTGPLLILNRLFPHLISLGRPIHLVTISSAMITRQSMGKEVYATLKAAKLTFSREMSASLTAELPGSLVTVVLPGPMTTSFHDDLINDTNVPLISSADVAYVIAGQVGLSQGSSFRPVADIGPFAVLAIEAQPGAFNEIQLKYLFRFHT